MRLRYMRKGVAAASPAGSSLVTKVQRPAPVRLSERRQESSHTGVHAHNKQASAGVAELPPPPLQHTRHPTERCEPWLDCETEFASLMALAWREAKRSGGRKPHLILTANRYKGTGTKLGEGSFAITSSAGAGNLSASLPQPQALQPCRLLWLPSSAANLKRFNLAG